MTTPWENIRQDLLSQNLINVDGLINSSIINSVVDYFTINPDDEEKIRSLFRKPQEVIARSSLSLCEMATEKVVEVTNQAAKTFVGQTAKVYLRGGTMRKLLANTISRIFYSLTNCDVLALTKPQFNKVTLDTDYLLYTPHCNSATRWHQILESGLVSHLTLELKKKNVHPADLAIELEQAHKRAQKLPPGSYAYEVAKQQGSAISVNDVDLEKKYVQMIAFTRAVNKSDNIKNKHYFERLIGHGTNQLSDDFTFSNDLPNPTRALDGLYVDLETTPLQLRSFNGSTGLIQAIFDAVLNNLTYDPTKLCAPTDFVRTLSFFMSGGSCFQKGWIDKVFQALVEEAKKNNITLVQQLARQLVSHTYNHYDNKHAALTCLTFNASAILVWKKYASRGDIRHLWNLVFVELDKNGGELEGNRPERSSTDLIEGIKMALRGGDCEFIDLYTQMQISATISMHQVSLGCKKYPCHQMLTEHHIFTKIQNQIQGQSYELILPYDLARSIEYAGYLYIHAKHLSFLKHLHSLLDDRSSYFAFDLSPAKKFAQDTRLERQNVVKTTTTMLWCKQEQTWWMGYLSSLAQCSLKKDEHLFKVTFCSLLVMLAENWAPNDRKEKAIEKMSEFLEKSGISFESSILRQLSLGGKKLPLELQLDLMFQCFKFNSPVMIEIGVEILKQVCKSNQAITLDVCKSLFDRCVTTNKLPHHAILKLIFFVQKSIFLTNDLKYQLLVHFFQHDCIQDDSKAEFELFKALVEALSVLPQIPEKSPLYGKHLQKIFLDIFRRRPKEIESCDIVHYFNTLHKHHIIEDQFVDEIRADILFKSESEKQSMEIESKWRTLLNDTQKTLQGSKTGSLPQHAINSLLQQLELFTLPWEIKDVLSTILELLANSTLNSNQMHALCQSLTKFQYENLDHPNQLAEFWLDQLQKIPDYHFGESAIKIRILMIEKLLAAFSKSNGTLLENNFYTHTIQNLTAKKTSDSLREEGIAPYTDSLFKEMHDRKLWESIILFTSLPFIKNQIHKSLEWWLVVLLEHFKLKNNVKDVLPILKDISELSILDVNLHSDHLGLWKSLAQKSLEDQDYLQLFKWLGIHSKQKMDLECWHFSFMVIKKAIKNGMARVAISYLETLPIIDDHSSEWLNIFETLLEADEMNVALALLNKNTKIIDSSKEKCTDLLKQTISCVERLLPFENKRSKDQIDGLLGLVHGVISNSTLGTEALWKKMIKMAVKGATLTFVEKLFDEMFVQRKAKQYFHNIEERMAYCWIPLFRRLGNEEGGSAKLIHVNQWMEFFHKEMELDLTWVEFRAVAHSTARGAVKFLNHIEDKNEKKIAAGLVDKLFCTEGKFNSKENMLMDDGEYLLNIIEIILAMESKKNLASVFKLIYMMKIMLDPSPSSEEKAVQLTHQALQKAKSISDEGTIKMALEVIKLTLASGHCRAQDYFLFLEFILSKQDKKMFDYARECFKANTGRPFGVDNIHFDSIMLLLELIFSLPVQHIPNKISQTHMNLVSQGVWQLFTYNKVFYGKFLESCLDKPNFKLFVHDQTRKQVELIRIFNKNYRLKSYVGNKLLEANIFFQMTKLRRQGYLESGSRRSRTLLIERKICKSCLNDCAYALKSVLVVATFATVLFYTLSLFVDSHKKL